MTNRAIPTAARLSVCLSVCVFEVSVCSDVTAAVRSDVTAAVRRCVVTSLRRSVGV